MIAVVTKLSMHLLYFLILYSYYWNQLLCFNHLIIALFHSHWTLTDKWIHICIYLATHLAFVTSSSKEHPWSTPKCWTDVHMYMYINNPSYFQKVLYLSNSVKYLTYNFIIMDAVCRHQWVKDVAQGMITEWLSN